jgi:hypothetical protein
MEWTQKTTIEGRAAVTRWVPPAVTAPGIPGIYDSKDLNKNSQLMTDENSEVALLLDDQNKCRLVSKYRDDDNDSSRGTIRSTQRWDVLQGTYAMEGSKVVVCNWAQHVQKVYVFDKDGPDTDKDWAHMAKQASTRWARLNLGDFHKRGPVEEVRTISLGLLPEFDAKLPSLFPPPPELPEGPVIITSSYMEQCMYAKEDHDGKGRRWLGFCKATPAAEAQATWIITPAAPGRYTICSHWKRTEYLYATRHNDGHGRRYVHTWMKGGVPEDDPWGLWRIEQIKPGVLRILSDAQGEYLYATRYKCGLYTWMNDGRALADTDPQGWWTIQAVTPPPPKEEPGPNEDPPPK